MPLWARGADALAALVPLPVREARQMSEPCTRCEGKGVVYAQDMSILEDPCPRCKGSGIEEDDMGYGEDWG